MAVRSAGSYAADGCLIKPLMLTFLQSPHVRFDFNLEVDWTRSREPDGWFHSSAHPSLGVEELILYLQGRTEPWKPDYVSTMSTLFGSMVHSLVQQALISMRVMVPLPEEDCAACGLPRPGPRKSRPGPVCREHGAIDPATRSRGHLDAIVDLAQLGTHGLDIKTIKPWGTYGLKDAPDMDLEYFKARWTKYYGQGQDYMRMTGLRSFIFFFMAMGNPWEMREYHVPYDIVYAHGIETRYKRALQATA